MNSNTETFWVKEIVKSNFDTYLQLLDYLIYGSYLTHNFILYVPSNVAYDYANALENVHVYHDGIEIDDEMPIPLIVTEEHIESIGDLVAYNTIMYNATAPITEKDSINIKQLKDKINSIGQKNDRLHEVKIYPIPENLEYCDIEI